MNLPNLSSRPHAGAVAAAMLLSIGPAPTWGQAIDHSMHQPVEPAMQAQEAAEPEHPHAGHQMPPVAPQAGPMDHAAMGHGTAADQDLPASAAPRDPIPPVTPADRAAAYPEVGGDAVHDTAIHSYWLLDRLEIWDADSGTGMGWEALAWVGTDLDRLWLRSEGERVDGATESADVEALYGRAIARWWDLVAGVRHDFGEGPSRTLAAVGAVGVAPYKFEIDATAYLGESGQSGLRLEAEYATLFTNRLIGQWLVSAAAWGQDDPERRIGNGLSTLEAGLRLRYEFHRQFAPYIGVGWDRAYGDTADYRREELADTQDTRLLAGVRIWF